MSTAAGLFGGNSDGYARMEAWLEVMCRGCVKDRGRSRTGMGGTSCSLPLRAGSDSYGDVEMPEWSADASPLPARLAELDGGRWPVCLAYVPRKERSDKGKARHPRGMEPLFETAGGAG
ncbi:MAG TPA: hypothetical protein VKU77_19490 [Streptosporangiaceae bacterium]|nr:hypothetical protein [Streptosporangiaceae bacterium]